MCLKKKTILTFVPHYLPGYKGGGPIRSICNLILTTQDTFTHKVITSDRDLGDTGPYPCITANAWNRVGPAEVWYLSPSSKSIKKLLHLLKKTRHDVVYLNGFFDPFFTSTLILCHLIAPSIKKPVLLAPRGEFCPGALALKALKKHTFISAAKLLQFHREVFWHATSLLEKRDISKVFPLADAQKRIYLAGIPAAQPKPSTIKPKTSGPLRVVFVSRIAPKKNLSYAIQALRKVTRRVDFAIYGPIEDSQYWAACKTRLAALPSNIRYRYGGPLKHENVIGVISGHDILFFPTLGENYGHIIREAILAGLKVLISDRTPWRGLRQFNLGDDLPLEDTNAFAAAIDQYAAEKSCGTSGPPRVFPDSIRQLLGDSRAVEANCRMFSAVANNASISS